MEVILETPRLRLRRLLPGDVEDLLALHNDPEVMRFLTGGTPVSREEIEREYRERLVPYGYLAAVARSSEGFLGWFGIHRSRDGGGDDEPGDLWLGYRLRRSAWGRGYATEGCRALIRLAFEELGAGRVRATTMAVNTCSRRVMERSGLSYARTLHLAFDDPLPGTELGEVEYRVTRERWEMRNGTRRAG